MKYVSIYKVLGYTDIPEDRLAPATAIEWAARALKNLEIRQAYSKEYCTLTISNHQAMLPEDLHLLEAVVGVSDEMSGLSNNTTNESYEEPAPEPTSQTLLQKFILWYQGEESHTFYFMRPTNLPFTTNFHVDCCPNLESDCQDTYTITDDHLIRTSFDIGEICIAYLAFPKDDCGDMKIPDDEDLITALSAYIQYKFLSRQIFSGDRVAYNMYLQAGERWARYKAKVRAKFLLKDETFEDVIGIFRGNKALLHSPGAFHNQYRYNRYYARR